MGIWKDKTGKWKYNFQKDGKNYGGGGYLTRREAVAAREDRRRSISAPSKKNTGYKLDDMAALYLSFCFRRFVKKTAGNKVTVIQRFVKHIGDITIDAVTPHMIEGFLRTRPTNNSWNAYRKDIAAMWEYGVKVLQWTHKNPVRAVAIMPHTPEPKRIPTEAEVLRLIQAAGEQDRALLMVYLNTLARKSEIFRLRWEDVNLEARTITLWTRKRKGGSLQADVLPMNEMLASVLDGLWQKRTQNEWVFLSPKTGKPYRGLKRKMEILCRRAGISPPFGFHALRHFMASFLADRKKRSTKTVQKLLRHKNINTTERYLHSIGDGMREAMDEAGELFQDKPNFTGKKVKQ